MAEITERQAFDAMALFLNEYFKRAGDDLTTLLADIEFEPDGDTVDPAAWDDWTRCVEQITSG
jgi:hypothetical protein